MSLSQGPCPPPRRFRRRVLPCSLVGAAALSLLTLAASGAARLPLDGAALARTRLAPSVAHPSGGQARVVATTDAVYPVTPLVARRVRSFVLAKSDLDRSTSLAWVVVPLVLAILVEAELLAVAGRPAARTLRVFGWSLVAVFAMLVIVRLRAYAE